MSNRPVLLCISYYGLIKLGMLASALTSLYFLPDRSTAVHHGVQDALNALLHQHSNQGLGLVRKWLYSSHTLCHAVHDSSFVALYWPLVVHTGQLSSLD